MLMCLNGDPVSFDETIARSATVVRVAARPRPAKWWVARLGMNRSGGLERRFLERRDACDWQVNNAGHGHADYRLAPGVYEAHSPALQEPRRYFHAMARGNIIDLGTSRDAARRALAELAGRDFDAEEAARRNLLAGLPAIEGSPKQIPWATDVRAQLVPAVTEILGRRMEDATVDVAAEARNALAMWSAEPEARRWIDRREQSPAEHATRLFKQAENAVALREPGIGE